MIIHAIVAVPVDLHNEIAALKNMYMMEAMKVSGGNINKAARSLHISYHTMIAWLREMEERSHRIVQDIVKNGDL